MAYRQLSDEQLKQAEHLLNEGMSVADTAEATGISVGTLYKKFQRPDPKPGGNGTARRRTVKPKTKPGPTDEQLTRLFAKVAVAPAIPMGVWAKCEFCAAHFANTGPEAAAKLVELSQDHPALRSLMEGVWKYADEVAWAGILATWAGVPVAHHLAPEFIYKWLQLPMGLPPRGVTSMPTHAHPPTNGSSETIQTPFGEMDTDSLLRMAESFGMPIDRDAFAKMMNGDAAAPPDTPATETDTAAETDTGAGETETAAPDSDPGE